MSTAHLRTFCRGLNMLNPKEKKTKNDNFHTTYADVPEIGEALVLPVM